MCLEERDRQLLSQSLWKSFYRFYRQKFYRRYLAKILQHCANKILFYKMIVSNFIYILVVYRRVYQNTTFCVKDHLKFERRRRKMRIPKIV